MGSMLAISSFAFWIMGAPLQLIACDRLQMRQATRTARKPPLPLRAAAPELAFP